MVALQLLYVGLGLAMNVWSIRQKHLTGFCLTPTNPMAGSVVMIAYGVTIPFRLLDYPQAHLVATLGIVAVIAYGGVYSHWKAGANGLYAAPVWRWVAVSINLFGVVAGFLACFP